jgi:cytoskeletal protein CcmA (bactofilin family)
MWWSKQTRQATPSFPPPFITASKLEVPVARDFTEAVFRKVAADEDVRVDSVIEKPISLKCCRLTIGPTAKVRGDVVAKEIIVYGELSGTLRGADQVDIKASGSVIGDITARRIVIENGAFFKGEVQIERRRTPRGVPELAALATV